jgi:hypothetical protein
MESQHHTRRGKRMPSKKRSRKVTPSGAKPNKFTIPKRYIAFTIVALCVFVLGGGIYNILEHPRSIIPLQNGYTSLHPYMSEQTSTEGDIIMLINGLMIMGFYMTYRSTQIAYNKRSANMWLLAGIILIIIGFSGNYVILNVKQSLMG